LLACFIPFAHALEHITLANGFAIDCVRREPMGDKFRLYLSAENSQNYMDVAASAVVRIEVLPDPVAPAKAAVVAPAVVHPRKDDLTEILSQASVQHNVDADLLAAVVAAESGGHVRAVSRAGAQGLMQLMPGTAATLGVHDAFAPADNVDGGTRYLDTLLTRYHDDIALALAAYNAGPAAVDRYHGIPPYRETRAYVARVIREFNRRKTLELAQSRAQSHLAAETH
jgi:soluble lytic murein transglycosylase-like protein